MGLTISKEIIQLDPEAIDFNDKVAVKGTHTQTSQCHRSANTAHRRFAKKNQSLKDEISRLKGEKGKPKFPPEKAEKKKEGSVL